MKKLLLKVLFFSILSLSIKAIDFSGEFYVKEAPVIFPNKIVVYKDGKESEGKSGLFFNYKIKKNKTINSTEKVGEQIYWIKQVPQGPGLTEKEIRELKNVVHIDRIQVGMANSNKTVLYSLVKINPITTFSAVGMGAFDIVGTLGVKAIYNDNLKIFLVGTAGSKAGEIKLNGKFGIKVTS